MGDPKTRHTHMPDGRTLCDRRATPNHSPTLEERAESATAPVCGACLLVLHILRCKLTVIAGTAPSVWPATAAEAAAVLAGTRWDGFYDLATAAEVYDSLMLLAVPTIGFTPQAVDAAIDAANARAIAYGEHPGT